MLVVTDIRAEPPVYGDLFAGKKFWIAQRTPSRADYIARVRYNGGEVVPLEKQADYLVVDHLRADLPAGSTSYRFIDKSIERCELQDPDDPQFRCGPPPGAVRDVGSARPVRHGRTPFTADDDAELTAWVRSCRSGGDSVSGNEIYKALERRNNRHPWQSWRDRWVKTLSKVEARPSRPVTVNVNPPPSPPSDAQPARSPPRLSKQSAGASEPVAPTNEGNKRQPTRSPARVPPKITSTPRAARISPFTLEHFDMIFCAADDIMNIPYGRLAEAWRTWSERNPAHSGEEWARYFDTFAKPIHAELYKNPARALAYDQAWDEWYQQNCHTATVTDWIEHYRAVVLPSFPPALVQDAEVKEEQAEAEHAEVSQLEAVDTSVEDEEEQASRADGGTRNAKVSEEPLASASTTPKGPSSVTLGKRRREDTEPGTPSPKRLHADVGAPFPSIEESIETTPSNRSLFSARASEVRQDESSPGIASYSRSQVDAGSQLSENDVRNALADLSESDMFDLLAAFRARPVVPQEQDGMDLLDILTMHALHYLSQPMSESQALLALGAKLEDLGVFAKLFGSDDGSEDESEYEEDQEQERGQETDEHGNLWLEVAQGIAEDDNEWAEEEGTPGSEEGEEQHSAKPVSLDEHSEQLRPQRRPAVQPSSDPTSSPQKHHTRPTSSSGGTTMTSFEMTTEATYDLTSSDKVETYISSRLAPPYSFSEEQILVAMHATCCNSSTLADAVLRWMRTSTASKSRKGRRSSVGLAMLPDKPGVWTEEDDSDLQNGLPSEMKRVEMKHGRLRCKRRKDFLAAIDG